MKKIYIPLILMSLSMFNVKAQVGGTWQKLNVGSSVIQTAIDFPSEQDMIGYTASMSVTYQGNGNIFKTTDGGTTWSVIWSGSKAGFSGLSFISTDTGFVAGLPAPPISWSGLGKTTNGGQTWTSMSVPSGVYNFTDVHFRDQNHGILLAQTNSSAAAYVTNDGGTTWTSANGISNGIPNRVCFVSGTTWFLVDNSGHIKKSVDDGLTWSTVYSGGPILLGIAFYNDNIGEACGDNGALLKTINGGNSWSSQSVTSDIWHEVAYEDQNNIYAVGTPEIIYKSTNGGNSWSNNYSQSTYNNAFYDIQITPNGTVWVCGSQGVLMRKFAVIQANFSASQTETCSGDSILFTSTSTGNNLSYSWYFEGGNPSTSSAVNPVIKYNNAGSFGVKLTISNGVIADSVTRPNYITVDQTPPAPVISLNGSTLTSNTPAGNQWYRDGNLISGATSQTYDPVQTGWYWDVVTTIGCPSDTSNNIYRLFVGFDNQSSCPMSVFPAPCNGKFTISATSGFHGVFDIKILNSLGQTVYKAAGFAETTRESVEVDLGSVPGGLYFITALLNGKLSKTKILIKR